MTAAESVHKQISLEVFEPNLGVFRAELVDRALNSDDEVESGQQYCFLGLLDFYQSNCLRQWLDMRWQSKTLEYSTVFLPKNNEMRISKLVYLSNGQEPEVELRSWVKEISKDFAIYLNSRK